MTDEKLLEFAAKAAGMPKCGENVRGEPVYYCPQMRNTWNPLQDDGDAFRLAVKLNLSLDLFDDEIIVGYTTNNTCDQVKECASEDHLAAARRAVVRAAAEIGASLP